VIIQFVTGVMQSQPDPDFGQNIIVSGLAAGGAAAPSSSSSAARIEGLRRPVGRMMR
jgi:hypothetical protein